MNNDNSKRKIHPTKLMLIILVILLFVDSLLKSEGIMFIDSAWSNIILFIVAFTCSFIYKIVFFHVNQKNIKIRRTMYLFGITGILIFIYELIMLLLNKNKYIIDQMLTKEGSIFTISFFISVCYIFYLIIELIRKKSVNQ